MYPKLFLGLFSVSKHPRKMAACIILVRMKIDRFCI